MTVPGTCTSGHAVLPGESYCPSCGEYLKVGSGPRGHDPRTRPAAGPTPPGYPSGTYGAYGAYPAQPYGPPQHPYMGPAYPVRPYAPYFPPPYVIPSGPEAQYYGAPGAYWQPVPHYPPPSYYVPRRPVSGLAIASLVLGLLWFWWVGSILAVIFGHLALRDIRRRGHQGEGLAIGGLILGWIGVATLAIFIVADIAVH